MGFTEILFIALIAVLFLGPDKLPEAMVQIAKLFKSISKTVNEAKSSFEEEIHIKELREEALGYRRKIEEASDDIAGFKNALPNPAAELQDAVASIGGDRYLDEDILADIEEAEQAAAEKAVEPLADIEAEIEAEIEPEIAAEAPPKKPKKKPKKSSKKKKPAPKDPTPQTPDTEELA
jgi:sec-independent protein translocase protein TatB